ncbi:MAG: hypothetical protein IJY36_06110 [Coprobacter sp.]|nr:hypothetical protein [Coprobacter sp.]
MRKIQLLIFIALLAIPVSCERNEYAPQDDIVELSFRLFTSTTSTRGNVSDYPSSPDYWSQSEQLVDGRYFYLVSVYIVDENREIVASQENIEVDGGLSEVEVTFDKSYGLKRGIYTLMAVANYNDHEIAGTSFRSGLVSAWASTDYETLMNNMIAGSATDNISSCEVVQPLSLMQEIELHAGRNMVEGELIRTFARLRIEVKNNSGSLPLKIRSVTFSDNFTQKQAYVFDDGTDRKYFGDMAAPLATSSYALTPFTPDTDADYKTIEAQTGAVVFDSYLLESRVADGENYTYTLDLEYEGAVETTYAYEPNWSSTISQTSNLSVGDESYFLLYNPNRRRYLSAGDGVVSTATLSTSSSTVGTDNVWQLIATGTQNQYYIKNVETGLYMQAPVSSGVSVGSSPVAFTFATRTQRGASYITMRGGSYYVNVSSSGGVQGSTSTSSTGNYFRLYVVNKTATQSGNGTISYNTPIVLTTIDPLTQQSSPATSIRRNDFINVLVTVSYNPEAGKFEFYVEDWNVGSGDVEFN